jgi:hypothetical protein
MARMATAGALVRNGESYYLLTNRLPSARPAWSCEPSKAIENPRSVGPSRRASHAKNLPRSIRPFGAAAVVLACRCTTETRHVKREFVVRLRESGNCSNRRIVYLRDVERAVLEDKSLASYQASALRAHHKPAFSAEIAELFSENCDANRPRERARLSAALTRCAPHRMPLQAPPGLAEPAPR